MYVEMVTYCAPPSSRAPSQEHLWDDDTEDDIPDFDLTDEYDSVMEEEITVQNL